MVLRCNSLQISFPRKRGSRPSLVWIPAFAGTSLDSRIRWEWKQQCIPERVQELIEVIR